MSLLILKSLMHISKEEKSLQDRFYTLRHPEYRDIFFFRTRNSIEYPSISFIRIFKKNRVSFQRINLYSKIDDNIEIFLNTKIEFQDYTDIELVMINGRKIIDENVINSHSDQFVTAWRLTNHLNNETVIDIGDLDE